MCGIIGCISKNNAIDKVICGLKNLEYRGYDSAGLSYIENNQINTIKALGKITNLEQKLDQTKQSSLCIGHTRWATHGNVTLENCHPHTQGQITLVHNGIIENYATLKQQLEQTNYHFQGQTDSEVVAAYLDKLLKENNNSPIKALTKLTTILEGSYALGIIIHDHFDKLYTIRKDSPLIIGLGKNENFIASDVPAILDYTNQYYLLENNEIAIITPTEIKIYHHEQEITKEIQTYNFAKNTKDKNGFEHYMLKEIHEQATILRNLLENYNTKDKLLANLPNLNNYQQIEIVACGSAYHAGMIGKYLIEKYGNIPVSVDIASEFRYKKLFLTNKTLVIVISQSGETADTLASLRIAKEHGCPTLGIINVEGSSIAREVDQIIYTKAGIEVAVATTKGYTTQSLILALLALKLGIQNQTISQEEEIFNSFKNFPIQIEELLTKNYLDLSQFLQKHHDIYFLGRNIDYAIALEGALKLKEISYLHAETYAAGELKHGTIALIEQDTPVITVITEPNIAPKTISNMKEVKARGAHVVALTTPTIAIPEDCYDQLITIPQTNYFFQPILAIIPMQILAYHTAKLRNCDIDKPKNLAKSVTVE